VASVLLFDVEADLDGLNLLPARHLPRIAIPDRMDEAASRDCRPSPAAGTISGSPAIVAGIKPTS
jgi:hypothetical protein